MRAILAIVLFTSNVYLGLLDRETTRKVAVVLLVVAFVAPSIFSVSFGYPFGQVGLFGNAGPTEITEYEVVVVDEDGTRLQYDARAVSPLTDDGSSPFEYRPLFLMQVVLALHYALAAYEKVSYGELAEWTTGASLRRWLHHQQVFTGRDLPVADLLVDHPILSSIAANAMLPLEFASPARPPY